MSLDAVERQGMPFVGETGGVGSGRRRRPRAGPATARPTAPACRPTRPSPSAWPRPAARPTRISTTTRRARRARSGCSDDRGRAVPAVGGTRTVPAPDPVARDYILLALRLDQHIPGLVDGYFGPADAQGPGRHGAAPRRRPASATTRPPCAPGSPAEVAEPDRRAWLDVQLVALETQAAALAGEALPYLEHVDALLRLRAAATPGRPSSRPPRPRIDELLPGDGPLADRLAAWDAAVRGPGRAPARPSSTGSSSASGAPAAGAVRPARRRGPAGLARPRPAVERLQLVRRRPPVAGRHQHRPAGPRAEPDPAWSPTRPTRATTSSTPGRRPSWSTARAASRRRSCSSTRPSA